MDMWLLDIKAPYKFFVALGKFNYGVALSYIAAYIFYMITVHYPETKSAISIYTAVSFSAKAIVSNTEYIFVEMAKMLGEELNRENLSDDKIKEVLSKTKCYGESPVSRIDLSHYNWLEYLEYKSDVIKSFQRKTQLLYPKMAGEYIAALSAVEQDETIEQVIKIVNTGVQIAKMDKENMFFRSGLENMFIEYYEKVRKLANTIDTYNKLYGIND